MKPWFRFYVETLDDPKVQTLAPDLFKHWVNILCIAAKNDGVLPSVEAVAFGLRVTNAEAGDIVTKLAARELLDPVDPGYFHPHNWEGRQYKSDASNERVNRHREKKRNAAADDHADRSVERDCNVTGNGQKPLRETDQTRAEQNRADQNCDDGGGAREASPAKPSKPIPGESDLIAGPLWKLFCDAYRGPVSKVAEQKFRAILRAGVSANTIIDAAPRANPEMPAEQWLAEEGWAELPLPMAAAPKPPLISEDAHALGREIAEIAGQDWQFLEPGWCGAPFRCQQWLDEGWPRELIVAGVSAQVKTRAPEKISNIAYFDKGLARFIAQRRRPVPQVIEHQAQTVEVTRGRHEASGNDSRSGVAAIDKVYARFEQQMHLGDSAVLPKAPIHRLPS